MPHSIRGACPPLLRMDETAMLEVGDRHLPQSESSSSVRVVTPKFWNFRCKFLLPDALSARKLTHVKVQNTTRFHFMLYSVHPAWTTLKMRQLASRPVLRRDAGQKMGCPGKNGTGDNRVRRGNFNGKRVPSYDMLRDVRQSIYSNQLTRGQQQYNADADCSVLDGDWHHIMNVIEPCMCVAAMHPCLKLLWMLVLYRLRPYR